MMSRDIALNRVRTFPGFIIKRLIRIGLANLLNQVNEAFNNFSNRVSLFCCKPLICIAMQHEARCVVN